MVYVSTVTRTPLFDIIKAPKLLERVLSDAVARVSDNAKLEWMKLGKAHPNSFGIKWRLRNVETGRYLDTRTNVSRDALALVGSIGSKSKSTTTKKFLEACTTEVGSIASVIAYGLKMPQEEWSKPRARRRRAPGSAVPARIERGVVAPHVPRSARGTFG